MIQGRSRATTGEEGPDEDGFIPRRRLPGAFAGDKMGRARLGTSEPTARLAAVRAFADAVVYGCFRLLWAVLHAVPSSVLRRGLEAVGHVAWLVDRRHRDIVAGNL